MENLSPPGVAAVLSLILPGAGQIYNGKFLRALFWLIVTPGLWIGSGGMLGWICHIVSAYTAYNWAKRAIYHEFFRETVMRRTIIISAALLLSFTLPAAALDEPEAKFHEFNTKVPTTFEGATVTMAAPEAGAFNVYVSGPVDAKRAILLIHEWWGLNAHIKGLADQLGHLGYRTYAIDLYNGKVAGNPATASGYMKAVNAGEAVDKLRTALRAMRSKHKKIGTIGWCFGGGWSLQASLAEPVDATVVYYGRLESDPNVLKKLRGPVLGVFAMKDGWITPAKVHGFEQGLKAANIPHTIKSYDADHAFANPSGNRFMLAPARDAWNRTLDFFEKNLK